MKNIIFDCDNAMGIPGKDIDDGMVLLYLYRKIEINILGITTVFGNDTVDNVFDATKKMYEDLELKYIPIVKGANKAGVIENDASNFIIRIIKNSDEPITLLITGPATNVYGALKLDPTITSKINRIIFMGGITEPLIINNKEMKEENFTNDPQAVYNLLNSGVKCTVITGNLCKDMFFNETRFKEFEKHLTLPAFSYMYKYVKHWMYHLEDIYKVLGFHIWDLVAALYLTNPELFENRLTEVESTVDDLKTGLLKIKKDDMGLINIPKKIIDIEKAWELIFEGWKAF